MNFQVIQLRSPANLKRLLDYQEQTEKCQNATTRMLRNANFIHLWEARNAVQALGESSSALRITPESIGRSNRHQKYRRPICPLPG